MLTALIFSGSLSLYAVTASVVFGFMFRKYENEDIAIPVAIFWPVTLWWFPLSALCNRLARFGMWVAKPRRKEPTVTIPKAKVHRC